MLVCGQEIAFSERSKGKIWGKSQLVVSYQVVTDPCCSLNVIFCGFILHLIGRETINIPEIFSGVHGFPGKTVSPVCVKFIRYFISSSVCVGGYTDADPHKFFSNHISNNRDATS